MSSRLDHKEAADVVPEKVESLSRGEIPILEKGLDELVREGLKSGMPDFALCVVNAEQSLTGAVAAH